MWLQHRKRWEGAEVSEQVCHTAARYMRALRVTVGILYTKSSKQISEGEQKRSWGKEGEVGKRQQTFSSKMNKV